MNDWTWNLDVDEEEYLAHHGILGQKWGVRRYQNEDGTLTAAGRARAIRSGNKQLKQIGKETYESSTWSRLYEKKTAKVGKSLNKAKKKDPNSKRSKYLEATYNNTKAYKDYYHQKNKSEIKKYENTLNKLINDYGSEGIKSGKAANYGKEGVQYIKKNALSRLGYSAFEPWYELDGHTRYTDSGQKYKDYRPTKVYRYYY